MVPFTLEERLGEAGVGEEIRVPLGQVRVPSRQPPAGEPSAGVGLGYLLICVSGLSEPRPKVLYMS